MPSNLALILLLRRTKLCSWRRKDSTDLPMFVHAQCTTWKIYGLCGPVPICNKQSCMWSPSIPGCRLSGDIPLGSSNPRCPPYWTIPCSRLQRWCDISRVHSCDAKAVWKPHENNQYGEIARLSKPAFDFVNERQFKLWLWPKKLLDALSLAMEQNKPELVKIFKLMLPKLAEGWLRQRRVCLASGISIKRAQDFFLILTQIFSTRPQSTTWQRKGRLDASTMNWKSEEKIPQKNSSNMKAQSYELLELDSTILRELRKISRETNELTKSWVEQQNQLTCARVSKKETENLKIDKRRKSNLSKLKDMVDPFVSAPEVDLYVAREDFMPKEKDTRLYLEVRYTRDSCLSLPK